MTLGPLMTLVPLETVVSGVWQRVAPSHYYQARAGRQRRKRPMNGYQGWAGRHLKAQIAQVFELC